MPASSSANGRRIRFASPLSPRRSAWSLTGIFRETMTLPRRPPLRVVFDATVTPVAPLGRLKPGELGKLQFPVLLHFPDWGSLLVRAKEEGPKESTWDFSLLRDQQARSEE